MTSLFWAAAASRQDGAQADGIHLLWTAPYAAGYSVAGYDIQRRESRFKPSITCYRLTQAEMDTLHRDFRVITPAGLVAVQATQCPKPPGELPDTPFQGSGGDDDPDQRHCVDLGKPPGRARTLDAVGGLQLEAFDARGAKLPHVRAVASGGPRGADCAHRLDVTLPQGARRVLLTLVHFARPPKVAALDAAGTVVAATQMTAPPAQPETLALSGGGIRRVVIAAPQDETVLLRVCWEPEAEASCVAFDDVDLGKHANPLDAPPCTVTAFDDRGRQLPNTLVRRMGTLAGLDCVRRLVVALAARAAAVRVTVVSFAAPVTVRARDGGGNDVDVATLPASHHAETATLAGADIVELEITAPQDEALLLEVCVTEAGRRPGRGGRVARAVPTRLVAAATQPAATGEPAGTGTSDRLVTTHQPTCLRYDIRLGASHHVVDVEAGVAGMLAIALREGKAVDSQVLHDLGGQQTARFRDRGVDQVLLYTGQRITALTICVDDLPAPADEAAEWAGVPYIAKGIQLPVRAADTTLATAAAELARASARLIAGETLDAPAFAQLATTLNAALNAGDASPMWYTMRTRERQEDPYIDIRPWPYALSVTLVGEWRRALGFGYHDAGAGLTAGARYDYRVTGHFLRCDLEEQLLAFHTIPIGTALPRTFYLGTTRLRCGTTMAVELHPAAGATALTAVGRKGIALASWFAFGPASLSITFAVPVMRVVLELEPARTASLDWAAKTSDYIPGLSGSRKTGTVTGAPRVLLEFAEPIDTLDLTGNGFLYGIRVLGPATGAADDVIDVSVVVPGVQYSPSAAPPPPPALGTSNLQQPILPGDPQVTTQNPPQPLGFTLAWQSPPPSGGTPPFWPSDLGAVPPTDVVGYHLERRRVDSGGPFEPVGARAVPTLYFGNRGARPDPGPLAWGADALAVFPEISAPLAPVDPWITAEDVLRSAAHPAGPPPGSLHQYRIFSVDAIGRRSVLPTTGSVVRLEKRLAPPQPPGPDDGPLPANVVRPMGVRARVLQASDPDLADDDVVLLGASTNAVVLEWGWTADERARDPWATEFRIYWHDRPPDLVRGTLAGPATMVSGNHRMAATLDQPVAADAMRGSYIRAPDYPFKVAGNSAGTTITIDLEPSVLQPGAVPGNTTFEFTPILSGDVLRPANWTERSAVVNIGPGAPAPYVFRDRLTLDAANPAARVWVGVSSADSQAYVPDELPGSATNGGRPGNESSIAPAVVEARYIGRPAFVVPPPLPNVPEDVSPEPVGPTVAMVRNLPALLPAVAIPAGHLVVVDHLEVGHLAAALSQRSDGTVGALFPDGTTATYTLGNPADHAALRDQVATGEAARIENRFLVDLLLRYPAKFEGTWERAVAQPVPFAPVTDTLPSKAERWLHRIRLSDPAGHVSEGAAIVPRMTRVASLRTPGAPEMTMPSVRTDTLDLTTRVRDAFDLKWLVLFTLVEDDSAPLGPRVRERAQLLRTVDRRDLYPNDGLRVRLADGTLLSPASAVDIPAAGTAIPPDIELTGTLTPGFEKRVSVWAVAITRDGIPSRLSGPVTALTGPRALVVPALAVSAAAGVDTATWAVPAVPAEVRLERSTDGEVTWAAVSPWLGPGTTMFTREGSGTRVYRLVLRGTRGQGPTAGAAVTPS